MMVSKNWRSMHLLCQSEGLLFTAALSVFVQQLHTYGRCTASSHHHGFIAAAADITAASMPLGPVLSADKTERARLREIDNSARLGVPALDALASLP